MARVMSFVMAVFIFVPIVAPSVGAGLIAISSWRTVFWFPVVYTGPSGSVDLAAARDAAAGAQARLEPE